MIDARRADRLDAAASALSERTECRLDRRRRRRPAPPRRARRRGAASSGRLDLLVNNASTLGASPLPAARHDRPRRASRTIFEVNVVAPLALIAAAARPCSTRARGTIVNITSDAAVEAYEGWGGYGSSKAALEQLSAVLAAEQPDAPGAGRRSRRHAHRDAPGRVPRRGHLRPAAPRGGRARPPRADRRRSARAVAYRRRGGRCHDRRAGARPRWSLPLDPSLEAHEPPEVRGRGRDDVRLLVSRRRRPTSCTPRSPTCRARLRAGDLVVVNTSATMPGRDRRRRCPTASRSRIHFSTELPGGLLARRGAAAGRRHDRRRSIDDLTGVDVDARRRRPPARCSTASPARSGCGSRRRICAATVLDHLARFGGRSATGTCPARGRSRRTSSLRRRARAARRCRARRGRSRPSSSSTSCGAASRSRRSSCTPACRRSKATSCRTPSATACPRDRRAS